MINGFKPFQQTLEDNRLELNRHSITTLQVNLGYLCNQTCRHCHVNAGPNRIEIMERNTIDRILSLIRNSPSIQTVDLTGGAPEMNPNFKYFITKIKSMGLAIISRCNLTVLLEKGQENTAQFLKESLVEIVSSLPCYLEINVNSQRGNGVFKKSIQVLKHLNQLGYGISGTNLKLNLVFNPQGASLPPEQTNLEADYKKTLWDEYQIQFNQLYTIINMPINRFERMLIKKGEFSHYMNLLIDNFNPFSANQVMCTDLISISWDGLIYDCDFNQMLNIPIGQKEISIFDIDSFNEMRERKIALENHCYGCTAGAGSSCTGATTYQHHRSKNELA